MGERSRGEIIALARLGVAAGSPVQFDRLSAFLVIILDRSLAPPPKLQAIQGR